MTMRILVVDDDDLCRLTTTQQLIEAGYEAQGFASPFSALEALKAKKWDVVLTDLRMPSMDGILLLEIMHKHYPDIPVILMTAYGTQKSERDAKNLYAYAYLCKPFSKDKLLALLKKLENELEVFGVKREVNPP